MINTSEIGIQPLNNSFTLGGVAQPSPSAARYKGYCESAKEFSEWVDEFVIRMIEENLSSEDIRVFIAQSKAMLHDRYYEWRKTAPQKHQKYTGNGHICLFHVYEATGEHIRKIELRKCPPEFETRGEREKRSEKKVKERITNYENVEYLDAVILGQEIRR